MNPTTRALYTEALKACARHGVEPYEIRIVSDGVIRVCGENTEHAFAGHRGVVGYVGDTGCVIVDVIDGRCRFACLVKAMPGAKLGDVVTLPGVRTIEATLAIGERVAS